MLGGDSLNIGAQVLEELADGLRTHLGPASLDVPGLLQLDLVLPSFLKVDNPVLPWHAVNPSRLQTVLNTICLNKKLNIPLVHGILELGTRDQALDNGFFSGLGSSWGLPSTGSFVGSCFANLLDSVILGTPAFSTAPAILHPSSNTSLTASSICSEVYLVLEKGPLQLTVQ
jgi:hypothetical protein